MDSEIVICLECGNEWEGSPGDICSHCSSTNSEYTDPMFDEEKENDI